MLSQLQCHIWEGSQTTAHRKAFQVAEGTEALHAKHQEVFPIVSCPGKDRGAAVCCQNGDQDLQSLSVLCSRWKSRR